MTNQLLELVSAYDFEVSVIKSSEGTSLDHAEWKAKGARAADCFWFNVPGIWMDGFVERLETLNRKTSNIRYISPLPKIKDSNKPLGENQSISREIRKMMLD